MPTPTLCWNCQAQPCLNGKPVSDSIKEGLRVMYTGRLSFNRGSTQPGQSGTMKSDNYAEFGTAGGSLGPSQREALCYSCE